MTQSIDWNAKADIARKMTDAELAYARIDCLETAAAIGPAAMIGKDASYYMDEASIYETEMRRRVSAAKPRAAALAEIARDVLGLDSLDAAEKPSGDDFHRLHVIGIERALREAYEAGRAAR